MQAQQELGVAKHNGYSRQRITSYVANILGNSLRSDRAGDGRQRRDVRGIHG